VLLVSTVVHVAKQVYYMIVVLVHMLPAHHRPIFAIALDFAHTEVELIPNQPMLYQEQYYKYW
jgi:hypothetical protein